MSTPEGIDDGRLSMPWVAVYDEDGVWIIGPYEDEDEAVSVGATIVGLVEMERDPSRPTICEIVRPFKRDRVADLVRSIDATRLIQSMNDMEDA